MPATFKTVKVELTCGTTKREMWISVDQRFSRIQDSFKMEFTESVGNLIANKIEEYAKTIEGGGCGHIWVSKTVQELFTTDIKCSVYKPMIGKVAYGEEEGVPATTDGETHAEMGWEYTVVSPLSPYALGGAYWRQLVDEAGDRNLSDVFEGKVDFEANKITVRRK